MYKRQTLQRLAESFSRIGVPVFMADVKGDLAGIGQPGGGNAKVEARVAELGLGAEDFSTQACPVTLWDILGDQGHPVRPTLSEMGPLLLARLLGLNETQEGVLNIVFRLADDNGWLLLDVKDLRALLAYLADDPSAVGGDYGHVSKASVGAIQRKLLTLEEQGAGKLFGEPLAGPSRLLKRSTDIIGASAIIVLTSPVWAGLADLIKRESPGPVFPAPLNWAGPMARLRFERSFERYLLDGERPIFAIHRHWAVLALPVTWVLGLIGVLVIVFIKTAGAAQRALVPLVLIALSFAVLHVLWEWVCCRLEWFILTDKRLLLTNGVIDRRTGTMPLIKVTDIAYHQPPVSYTHLTLPTSDLV